MQRVVELDYLRGIAVILMIFDHFMFAIWGLLPMVFSDFPANQGFTHDLVRFARTYWVWGVRHGVRYAVLFIFLGLTGVCCSFSKSNLARGLKLLAAAMALTAGTFVCGKITGDMDITIAFGVLHCVALALILIGLLEKITGNKWVYLAIGIVLTGIGIILRVKGAPFVSYSSEQSLAAIIGKSILGIAECGSDCFAFPFHGGQVFIGVFLGKLLFRDKQPIYRKPVQYQNNIITFFGRNSLWVYLVHQIIIPVVVGIVLLCCGFHIAL